MIPEDFKQLLPKRSAEEEDDRPVYYIWVWDPEHDRVHLTHNEDRHPADHMTHDELGAGIHHPDKVFGYAYSIKGGWRITSDEHKAPDHHIMWLVEKALRGEHPEPPLPHINYHHAA